MSIGFQTGFVADQDLRLEATVSQELQEQLTLFCTQGPAFQLRKLAELVQCGAIEMATVGVPEEEDLDLGDPDGCEADLADEDVLEPDDRDMDGLEERFPAPDVFELRVRPTASGPACDPPECLCGAARSLTQVGSQYLLAGMRRHEVYREIAAWLESDRGDLLARGPAALSDRKGPSQRDFARARLLSLFGSVLREQGEAKAVDRAASLLSISLQNARLSWGNVSVPLQCVFG